jgi:hypothetical protein
LSSSQRPGELVVDNFNKQGDPFDIKPYHPSDGMKRIIWKAFAKRGELLSRHPEASMTPEGYVVIFVLAGPKDDAVCSKVIAYVRMLTEMKLDVVVGCEGISGRSLATSPESTEKLLVDSVWNTYESSPESVQADMTALLDYCTQTARSAVIQKLILFSSGERIVHHESLTRQLGTWLNSRSISPVFCLTPPSSLMKEQPNSLVLKVSSLFVIPETSATEKVSTDRYRAFLSGCARQQWEVYV